MWFELGIRFSVEEIIRSTFDFEHSDLFEIFLIERPSRCSRSIVFGSSGAGL